MNDLFDTEQIRQVDRRRGHKFRPPKAVLRRIPALYATEQVPTPDKTVWLHFFVASADWYVVELDRDTGEAFGWAELLPGGGEWGYTRLPDLGTVLVHGRMPVERDLYWTPRPVLEIDRIGRS